MFGGYCLKCVYVMCRDEGRGGGKKMTEIQIWDQLTQPPDQIIFLSTDWASLLSISACVIINYYNNNNNKNSNKNNYYHYYYNCYNYFYYYSEDTFDMLHLFCGFVIYILYNKDVIHIFNLHVKCLCHAYNYGRFCMNL